MMHRTQRRRGRQERQTAEHDDEDNAEEVEESSDGGELKQKEEDRDDEEDEAENDERTKKNDESKAQQSIREEEEANENELRQTLALTPTPSPTRFSGRTGAPAHTAHTGTRVTRGSHRTRTSRQCTGWERKGERIQKTQQTRRKAHAQPRNSTCWANYRTAVESRAHPWGVARKKQTNSHSARMPPPAAAPAPSARDR